MKKKQVKRKLKPREKTHKKLSQLIITPIDWIRVLEMEEDAFVIQINDEVFTEGDYYAFDKENTEIYYQKIVAAFKDMKENGSVKDHKMAIKSLMGLRVIPLRIQ